jgi:hypothetical protein
MSADVLKKLIGMQLVNWDEKEKILTVKKGENLYHLVFDDSDNGACCGYNEFFAELYVHPHETERNPIITKVEIEDVGGDEWTKERDSFVITFFGESKALLHMESMSTSGSGECYGACVKVKCNALNIDERITSW